MKIVNGFYVPDWDLHYEKYFKTVDDQAYQINGLIHALSFCKKFRTSIDLGANVGFHSAILEKVFRENIAIEPVVDNYNCLLRNAPQSVKSRVAVGDKTKTIHIAKTNNCGGCYIAKGNAKFEAKMVRLEDFLPGEQEVDFIKMDLQGYEYFAIKGGNRLLRDNRPILMVEIADAELERYGLLRRNVLSLLRKLKYVRCGIYGKDLIFRRSKP